MNRTDVGDPSSNGHLKRKRFESFPVPFNKDDNYDRGVGNTDIRNPNWNENNRVINRDNFNTNVENREFPPAQRDYRNFPRNRFDLPFIIYFYKLELIFLKYYNILNIKVGNGEMISISRIHIKILIGLNQTTTSIII